ncbi:MAG: SpvB/TcaC N-terminal domain-containing protein [Methylococcales bacterium]
MADNSNKGGSVISLPQGGGALKGLGEKFSPDLFTGTGNFTVPIALPAGRIGFQPQISLSYSTGTGNGPWGFGWSLSIPGISRKTSKGIPRYRDAVGDSNPDVFILSGAEDLVPVEGGPVGAQRYRPRTEGLFALIDHFFDGDTNDYWRVQTKDGLVSYYGTETSAGSEPAVIANPSPDGHRQVCAWRLSRTDDSFGNRIEYEYRRDKGLDGPHFWDQLYLSQIRYVDYIDAAGAPRYLITVDFLYDDDGPPPGAVAGISRPDPFSEYRSGFEIRTRRRCKWIVVKTHPTAAEEHLVRAYEFVYLDERIDLPNIAELLPLNAASLLSQVDVIGYDDNNQPLRELPPVEFAYSRFEPTKRKFGPVTGYQLPPNSLASSNYELVDLFGSGLPDIFELNETVRYWRNLGNGSFDRPRPMSDAPGGLRLADSGVQLIDANGDGRVDLLVTTPEISGYFPLTLQGGWDHKKGFQRYQQAPSFNLEDPEVHLVDLDGDGVTDAIRSGTRFECFFNDPHMGWQADGDHVRFVSRGSLEDFPDVNFSDPRVRWADMTGDGLQDIVLIHAGNIEYWPNLGYGNFGKRIVMHQPPSLPFQWDPRRLLVGDVDGDGMADVLYIEDRKITLWINQHGNSWSSAVKILGTPPVTDLDGVRLVDLLGNGVAGVLWTRDARIDHRVQYFFFDFTGGNKPYLLNEMNNHIGAVTKVDYAPSTREYLRDQACKTTRWRTPLPFPVQVVTRVEVIDEISRGKLTTEYRYHHGYWDGAEREFRGFGMVEQLDTESFEKYGATGLHGAAAMFAAVDRKYFSAPTLTKTWFHQGPVGEEFGDWEEIDCSQEYWTGDPQLLRHTDAVNAFLLSLPKRRIKRDALRTLRGSVLRSEFYALDGSLLEDRPYTVTEHAYSLREEHPPIDPASTRERIFFPHGIEQRTTQWERGDDPLSQFSFTGQYDSYGQPLSQSAFAMPRRSARRLTRPHGAMADESGVLATHGRTAYAVPVNGAVHYIHNRVACNTSFTYTTKPLVTETEPGSVLALLREQAETARTLHQSMETDLRGWQPAQGNTAGYKVFAHAVNYYDGPEYRGEALGMIGDYGALTRSESLIFTDEILDQAYNDATAQRRPAYLGGAATLPAGAPANFGIDHGYLDNRGGIAGYVPGYYVSTQQQKFDFQAGSPNPRGLPVAMRDPLNNESTIDSYDDFQFLPKQVTDPKGLSIHAEYNLRVLQPNKVIDPNGNSSEVKFSPSGLVTETWIKGKNGEGDQHEPGSQMFYDFLAFRNTGNPISARAIKRAFHDTDLDDTGETIELHEYSDGFGRVIQTRTQGEDFIWARTRTPPEQADLIFGNDVLPLQQPDLGTNIVGYPAIDPIHHPNVVVSGWQIYDNKGKVVEKYEPFFSQGWAFAPEADSRHGVHVELYYDPRGQAIRTVNPDSSEQRVIYGVPNSLDDPFNSTPTPWEAYTYDPNDNAGRTHPNDASARSYQHHWNTPASIAIDAIGRTVRATARHRDSMVINIEEHISESSYDIQGNLLTITDALGRRAFGYSYDLAKHALRTESIDAGTRIAIFNAAGNPIEGRDAKGTIILRSYDILNRPTSLWARDDASDTITLREKSVYGDDAGINSPAAHNLLGKQYQHYDEAGVVTVADYDFKGNILISSRQVLSDDFMLSDVRNQTGPNWALHAPRVDWSALPADLLDTTTYQTRSAYDALNRIKWSDYPEAANGERYRLRPGYNRAGALQNVALEGPLGANDTGPRQTYVQRLAYGAKGQRTLIAYGNGLITRYAYDPNTFHLMRLRTESYTQPDARTYQPRGSVLQDIAYAYDLAGNILRIEDRTLGCGVRGNNDLTGIPDPVLRQSLTDGDALLRRFEYDPLYRLVSATGRTTKNLPFNAPWPDSALAGYNGGRHGVPDQDGATYATELYRQRYGYDAAGNMLSLAHQQLSQSGGAATWTTQWTRKFGMGLMTPASWEQAATVHLSGDWINGPGNQLTHFQVTASGSPAPGNNQTHFYDANGNMIRENTERHFEWDQADRMKVFCTQTGTSKPSVYALYLYDASGQRVKKLVWKGGDYSTTTYLGDAFEHHQEVTPAGTQQNNSLHVMDDKQRIAIQRVGTAFDDDGAKEHSIQYHLGDHLGSSAVVVNGDGRWINREEFSPYGEASFGSFARKRYRFTGKERDEESWLNYHGERYYSPSIARWISCDPAHESLINTQFSYCSCNPLSRLDSNGLADTTFDAEIMSNELDRYRPELFAEKPKDWPEWQTPPQDPGHDIPDVPNDLPAANKQIQDWANAERKPTDEFERSFETNPKDKVHSQRVIFTANFFLKAAIREVMLPSGELFPNVTRGAILKSAWSKVTLMRQNENLDLSDSILLRDVQRYFWGRIGIEKGKESPYLPDALVERVIPVGVAEAYWFLSKTAHLLNDFSKGMLGFDPDLLRTTKLPGSRPGGTPWFKLGIEQYWRFDKKEIDKPSIPELLHESP